MLYSTNSDYKSMLKENVSFMKIRKYEKEFFNGLTIGRKFGRKALYTCSDFVNLKRKYLSCPFVNFVVG